MGYYMGFCFNCWYDVTMVQIQFVVDCGVMMDSGCVVDYKLANGNDNFAW